MYKNLFLSLFAVTILTLTMLIPTRASAAKLYMGKISLQVGDNYEVSAVPTSSGYIATGSFSKSGTNFTITANGSYYCTIRANYVGKGTLSYSGVVSRSGTWTSDIYDMYWDVEVKAAADDYSNKDDIEINDVNFPDDEFRNWILEQSYGRDGKLTAAEINHVISINISGRWDNPGKFKGVRGVEYFTSLTGFFCDDNQLTALDVSKNTSLTELHCRQNQLTTLDVSKNTALESLVCLYNQLTDLDVSKNVALTRLSCMRNRLATLDVSKNTALTELRCYSNQIKGAEMDKLIASLPMNSTGKEHFFYVIDTSDESEGNVCTKKQVADVKARGWTPMCWDGSEFLEYEGSEDTFVRGDVNQDKAVNGTDLVALSNIILDRKEKTESADVNDDGSVNSTDIETLSDIIMGSNGNNQQGAVAAVAELSIKPFSIQAGEEQEILIDLSNPDGELTLVQFDLYLPEGLSVKKNSTELDFDMAERTTWRKHTLVANETDGGYRFLLYSSSDTVINGTDGTIIKVKVIADALFDGGKIVIGNALLVTPDEKDTRPLQYEYAIGSNTAIRDITTGIDVEKPVYNLRGQRLAAPQKGISIIGGKKVTKKIP